MPAAPRSRARSSATASGAPEPGRPPARPSPGAPAVEQRPGVRWKFYWGAAVPLASSPPAAADQWTDLPLGGDDTAGLARTGHLRLQLPERATRFSPEVL